MIEYKVRPGSLYYGYSKAALLGVRTDGRTVLVLVDCEPEPLRKEAFRITKFRTISPEGKMALRHQCSEWNRRNGNNTGIDDFMSQIRKVLDQ